MTAQQWSWGAAGVALVLAVVAGLADRRRNRRASLDDVGWVPWRGIQVAAMFAVLALAILGFKLGD
ncbi:hypothetical protein [Sphingosinicella sp. YJ22]|uniref:hypothetical protein n=1 Tax=Sphingosinicella sp. YJ22 TaxID=1104780 RepID=UPI001407C1C9|nr:hypothetical protein [Sphingosinicella sp. YJ22]